MSFLRRFTPPQILLAAAVPLIGYGLAFAYERGYAGRYGVPTWMSRVSLMQMLVASIVAAVLIVATPVAARALSDFASRWIARIVLAPAAALAIALWAASETEWRMGAHLIIPVLLIVGFGGFAALRIYRSIIQPLQQHGGSAMERLRLRALQAQPSRPIAALAWMGHRVRWTLAFLVVALFGANWYGNYASRHERNFLVSSSAPTCVAVRRYADNIVCAVTDLTRRRVLPRLRMLPASDTKEKLSLATLPTLRTPVDVAHDRKFFSRPRPTATTTTVYATRQDPEVMQAGHPVAAKHAPAKHAPAKHATTKKPTTKGKTKAAHAKPTSKKKHH